MINFINLINPLILVIFSVYLLWNKKNLIMYYLIGLFFNSLLNLILKGIIKQPRPLQTQQVIDNYLKNNYNLIKFNIYGMPSGHTQMCLYSSIFIWLALKNVNILLIYLFISGLIMYQRIISNNHTGFQVIVGGIIGLLVGYFIFYIATQQIKSKYKIKDDDYAPR